MASDRFRCPGCGSVLHKDEPLKILSQAGGFIGVGPGIPCPSCRAAIDPQKIIDGTYDVKDSGILTLLCLAWMFGGPFLLSLKFNWQIGWAIVAPWGSLLLLAGLYSLFARRR